MITEQEVKEKTIERFWSKIKFDEPDKCWEWQAGHDTKGYGSFMIKKLKHDRSHRVMYREIKGEIPFGLNVCHTCDNRNCVNPNHLWLGTYADNNHDRDKKGRQAPSKGSKNNRAILSEDDVINIKNRLFKGDLQSVIASDFGVCDALISHINTGILWKHVQI